MTNDQVDGDRFRVALASIRDFQPCPRDGPNPDGQIARFAKRVATAAFEMPENGDGGG